MRTGNIENTLYNLLIKHLFNNSIYHEIKANIIIFEYWIAEGLATFFNPIL